MAQGQVDVRKNRFTAEADQPKLSAFGNALAFLYNQRAEAHVAVLGFPAVPVANDQPVATIFTV